jgi:hypothetical protein
MGFRFYKLGWHIMLSGLVCSGLLQNHCHAQGTHKPHRFIELSETNSAEILTNLNRLTSKQDGVDQLEDQLRGIKGLSTSSLEQRLALPYVPHSSTTLPTKTIKELIERQKNWGLTPEQLGTSSSSASSSEPDPFSAYQEQKFNGTEPSLQQFYDALNRGDRRQIPSRPGNRNSAGANTAFDSKQDSTFDDDANLPPGLRDKAQKLKESASEDPSSIFNASKKRATFENFFGLNRPSAVPEGSQGEKTSMETFVDQFKKVLEGQPAAGTMDTSLRSLLPEAAIHRASSIPTSSDPLANARQHVVDEAAGSHTASVVPAPAVVPDLNGATLNRWNSLYNPPKLEIPKFNPPTPPNLDFPRRRF